MFSALVVLNLFDTDLILETIHLSVRWRFLNGLRPERIPHQQGGISSRPAPAAPGCSGSEPSAGRARGSISLWMISPVFPSYLQGVFVVSWWPVKWCPCGTGAVSPVAVGQPFGRGVDISVLPGHHSPVTRMASVSDRHFPC